MKKKIIIGIIIVGLVLAIGIPTLLPVVKKLLKTDFVTEDGITYLINSDGKGYSVDSLKDHNTPASIVIPSEVNGKPVTKILTHAFCDCSTVTSVVIPDSVTEIEDFAFARCDKLSNVTLPDSLTRFGENVFMRCPLPETVSEGLIYRGVSYTNGSKNDFYFLSGVQANYYEEIDSFHLETRVIDSGAFSGSTNIRTVRLPNKVHTVDASAFDNRNIEWVDLNAGLVSIGERAFSSCSLERITVPNTLEFIGTFAFPSSLMNQDYLGNASNPYLICCLKDDAMTEFTTHEGTKFLVNMDCPKLKEITVGANVVSIGAECFSGCTNLEKIDFAVGSKLERIERRAFADTAISSIKIPASVRFIDLNNNLFGQNNTKLASVVLENSKGWYYHDSGANTLQERRGLVDQYWDDDLSDSDVVYEILTKSISTMGDVYMRRP